MDDTCDPPSEMADPRTRRTRQMLHEALESLLHSAGIEKISVSQIAGRATLNRATFYDHYRDKFALLEGLVASRFQELLRTRQVVFNGSCPAELMNIILTMCDYLAAVPGVDCPNRQVEKHFESALIAVARETILNGLRSHSAPVRSVPLELIAATVSGAIYAGAREWVRTPGRCSADEVAKAIFSLTGPILSAG